MDNNFILLFTALLTAGSLGFINCFILEKLGVIIFRKSNEHDKKHFLLFFSLFNYIIYLLIFLLLQSKWTSLEELLIISVSVIITFIITFGASIYIFPFIASEFNRILNHIRKTKSLSEIEHRIPRDIALDNSDSKSVFIFDFNKTLISSGYLENYSNESDYYEITLVPFDEKPNLNNYEKVKNYSESGVEDKDIKILLDFEKKLQYFIVSDIN